MTVPTRAQLLATFARATKAPVTAYTENLTSGALVDPLPTPGKIVSETHRDDIVVFEVMAAELDKEWWDAYRRKLEHGFLQEEIVIRAQETLLL